MSRRSCSGVFLLWGVLSVIGLALPQARAAIPVNITVDPKDSGPQIPATFTGLSFETKLMYADAQGRRYFRPDNAALIAMFKTLGIHSLRIGGNTADKTDLPMPSDADIDSLFQFARAANVKVLYTLRLKGNPEPTEAAKAAKYIWSKYRDNVECFAIGNEPNVYVKTMPEYIALMQKYIDAIDSPDYAPGAKFSGPGSTPGKVAWSRELVDKLGDSGKLALITQHSYPGGSARRVASPTTGRATMLSDKWDADYQKFYDTFVPSVKEHKLGYRLEEANSFFYGGREDVSDTFASALWALDFMNWWAMHGCDGINFHTGDSVAAGQSLTPSRYAMFWSVTGGYHVHPIAYGVKAFDLSSHGKYQRVTLKAQDDLNLTAYAVRGDDNALFITVINKENSDTPRDASVTLSAGDSFSRSQSMMLTAPEGNLATKEGVTLGGGTIHNDASFDGKWTDGKIDGSTVNFELPQGSAVVLKLSN